MRAWVRAEGAAARRDWAPSVSAQRRRMLRLRIRSRWPRRGVTAGGLGICRGFEPGRGETNFPPEGETGEGWGRYRARAGSAPGGLGRYIGLTPYCSAIV